MDETLRQVATRLGRPAEKLVELDRRPLRLLTQPGSYATLTLRDRDTGQILEPTVDLATGRIVDATEIRQRERDAIERRGALTARLRRLLLRHPDVGEIQVQVTKTHGAQSQVVTDPAGVLGLADDPDVVRVDTTGEVEVFD
ncbi:MAG TPA: hypothetical protein VF062_13945 [Candidatus Limnocylindrales bacterium]